MANNYYTHGSFPSTGSAATSASMRAELDQITLGFDKLPTLTGNAGKYVRVAAGGTTLEAVTLTTGDVVGTTDTQTLTNKTLSTGTAITAGTINNAVIGGTTPAAGSFTTLSASSTVSGTGFSTYLASPPAIGGTTAAAGSFTTLSASSTTTLSGGTANGVAYLNGSKVVTTGTALTFDGTNLGVGGVITMPNNIAFKFKDSTGVERNTFYLDASNHLNVQNNVNNGNIAQTLYGTGAYVWNNGGTEQMRLTSTGLGIGTTAPAAKLVSAGSSATNFKSLILRNGDGTTGSSVSIDFEASSGTQGDEAAMAGRIAGVRLGAGTTGALTFSTTNGGVLGERMRLDSAGNLGLGVTPKTWSTGKAIEVGGSGASVFGQSGDLSLIANGYYNAAWKYTNTGAASRVFLGSGSVYLQYATSGTADGALTWTTSALFDSSGNMGLGVTPSAWSGSGRIDLPNNKSITSQGPINTFGSNWYFDGTSIKYAVNGTAAYYTQNNGAHQWHTAPSGTAGTAITFTQAMTLDASGNLGVGVTSMSRRFQVQTASVGTGDAISWSDNSTDTGYLGIVAGGGVRVWAGGFLAFGSGGGGSFTERARIDSSGNMLVGVTSANANGGILQLAGGITFPAAAVAATDANTLDDYEEGTWTPALSGTGSTFSTAGTYSAVGTYTKVGRQVAVQFRIQLNTTGNTLGAGTLTVTGLPFTSANVTNQTNYSTAAYASLTTSLIQLPFAILPNVTSVTLYKLTAAGVTTATQMVGTDLHATNGSVIGGTIRYFV